MNVNDWQSWAAPTVVMITAAVFLWRAVAGRRKKVKGMGCGGSCGCTHKPR